MASDTAPAQADIIDFLVGSARVEELRHARPQAKDNAQLAFRALLEPEDADSSGLN
ncbi:hypothetical protein [Corynebacterium atypicum]|uniref:hypothetical protein n=1 Tax=Corynebacterium atypicum TaxID=191610 RepID=UPI000AE1E70F